MHGFHIPTTVRHALLLEMSVLKKYIKKTFHLTQILLIFFNLKCSWKKRDCGGEGESEEESLGEGKY